MLKAFDISRFDEYREDNRREIKTARDNLPASVWDTYSSFANGDGGVIILGVKENKDGSWHTTGLINSGKQRKSFWDTINNRTKVSINLLQEKDLEIYEINGDIIVVIHVPAARREQKPVYINNDLFGGTFRRNWEGDYHCTPLQIKTMLRDQTEDTYDMNVLEKTPMSVLNYETLHSYRNRHQLLRSGHPFEDYSDEEYLRSIGAAAIAEDGLFHPTCAGLLMFGNEFNIIRQFSEYFLDYREILDPSIRWTDRLQSSSGDWSGNLYDFYFRVYNKLQKDIKTPFELRGGDRIDDTSVHKAIREVLANCLINADFFGKYGIVIKKEMDRLTVENPGFIRVGRKQMLKGGLSDPRNKALMKMFNMINVGERAGSGVPSIIQTWNHEDWIVPEIIEQFNPDRTIVKLSFMNRKNLGGISITQYPTRLTQDSTHDDAGSGISTVYSLTEIDLAIVSLMKKEPTVSQSVIAAALCMNFNTLKYHVRRLREKGIVEREGSSQKGRWTVKL